MVVDVLVSVMNRFWCMDVMRLFFYNVYNLVLTLYTINDCLGFSTFIFVTPKSCHPHDSKTRTFLNP